MEFGPRALGSRSIIADPRDQFMQKKINMKIKYREGFRPFAPIVLEDYVKKFFDIETISPYMLLVGQVKGCEEQKGNLDKFIGFEKLKNIKSLIPAVTHVNYSARIQTVSQSQNKKIYSLIQEFHKITNIPILVNTSFNIKDEPIVESPENAFKCFMGSGLDYMVCGNFLLKKMNSIMIDRYNKLAQFLIGQNKKKLIFDNNFFTDDENKFFLINNSIPDFFIEDSETKKITDIQDKFYNEIKFPNYDDLDDFSSLIDKANKSIFAKFLDEQIKFGSKNSRGWLRNRTIV